MNKLVTKLKSFVSDKRYRFMLYTRYGLYNYLSDEAFLKKAFRIYMGYELDLNNPRTYSEKIQWLKLHDRKKVYTTMVDKYLVKEYVSERIGEKYVLPILGVWNRFDDIDFESLPDSFVLKCTHDSGGVIVVKDKKHLDKQKAKQIISDSLKRNFYWRGREWPYKNVIPRIIAEQYVEDRKYRELRDYKFFVFNGKVKAMFIASERYSETETKFDYYDRDFNHLPFTNGHPNAEIMPEKPKHYYLMIELAEQLAEGIPHVRVDFYEANDRVYFGEYTFYHWGGMKPFVPNEYDIIFGRWLNLPDIDITLNA